MDENKEKIEKTGLEQANGGYFFSKHKYDSCTYEELGIKLEKNKFKKDVFIKPAFDKKGQCIGEQTITEEEANKLVRAYLFLRARGEFRN